MEHVKGLVESILSGGDIRDEIKDALAPKDIGRVGTAVRWLWQNAASNYQVGPECVALAQGHFDTIMTVLTGLGEAGGTAGARRVFISFSHDDEELGQALHSACELAGLVPFLSSATKGGLPAGKGWFEGLTRSMREADALVLLATPPCIREQWGAFESGAVYGRGNPTLSVMIGVAPRSLPAPLQHIQGVRCDDGAKVKSMLAEIVATDLEKLWQGNALAEIDRFLTLARDAAQRYSTSESASGPTRTAAVAPATPALGALRKMSRAIRSGEVQWNAEKKTGRDASTDEGNQ